MHSRMPGNEENTVLLGLAAVSICAQLCRVKNRIENPVKCLGVGFGVITIAFFHLLSGATPLVDGGGAAGLLATLGVKRQPCHLYALYA